MNTFITIANFELPQESYVIKSKLESEGIQVFLKDELTVQADNFISNAIGGVKLQVLTKDVEKAEEILALFDVVTYKALEPEKFVAKIDSFTKKIPLIGKLPLATRGMVIIVLSIVLTLLVFHALTYESRKKSRIELQKQLDEISFERYTIPKIDSITTANPKKAIKIIEKYLKKYPKNTQLIYDKAIAYYNIDSFAMAKKLFLSVVIQNEYRFSQDLSYIAFCDIELHNYKSAIKYLLEANKNNRFSYIIASTYEKDKNYTEALKYYNLHYDKKIKSYKEHILKQYKKENYEKYDELYNSLLKKKDSINNLMTSKIKSVNFSS